MAKKRMKGEYIKKTIVVLSVLFFIFVFSFVFTKVMKTDELKIECHKDSDCVSVRMKFCSCENGGTPKCIQKDSLREYISNFESCDLNNSCFVSGCGRINCGCVNHICVGKPI